MAHPSSSQEISTWRLDPAHSSIEFAVKHMMMTTVPGRFSGINATATVDEEHPERSSVEKAYPPDLPRSYRRSPHHLRHSPQIRCWHVERLAR